jgi:hypothetical protein
MEYHFLIILLEIIIFLGGFFTLWLYQKRAVEDNAKDADIYSDYLNSKKWEELRRKALERADYQCELCFSPYQAVHHIKYPKRYKNDHPDNLLVVCDKCHAKLHGIRNSTSEENILEENKNSYLEEVIAGSRSYSFYVAYSDNNKKYLRIIESGKRGEKKIEITEDNFELFFNKLKTGLGLLHNQKSIQFEERISTTYSTYFFEIKFAINQSKYLKVTESKKQNNKTFEQSQILVFEDEVKPFLIGLDNAINFVNQA